jgi:acyl-CoA thioester hydrolase
MNKTMLTYRGTVYPWHCDHMGHMNVMWYVHMFDAATWGLFADLGLGPSRLKRDGAAMAAVEQQITYRRELHGGDPICILSEVVDMSEKTIKVRHEMIDTETGEVAAIMHITGVFMDAAARRGRRLPDDVRADVLALIDDKILEAAA